MSDELAEAVLIDAWRALGRLAQARPDQLKAMLYELYEAQDLIALAIQKATK